MTRRLTSRRAALGAFVAAATVPAGIGLANPGAGAAASPDAALLAIAPKLIPLLERSEAMSPTIAALYEEADEKRDQIERESGERAAFAAWERLGEENGYTRLWDERNDVLRQAEEIIAPFIEQTPQTLGGLLLKARYAFAMGMEWIPEEDIAALLKQRWGVTKGGDA